MQGSKEGIDKKLVWLMAGGCGLSAANLYYAQPLFVAIAHSVGALPTSTTLLTPLEQGGYAAGLIFLVPLGDFLDRKRFISALLAVAGLALLGAAVSPTLAILALFFILLGLTSVVAQILVAMAAALASDAERGKVVGSVMSGLLVGILLARTVAGFGAQILGWRVVFLLASLTILILSVVMFKMLPKLQTAASLDYGALLATAWKAVIQEPILRRRSLYGAGIFAAFNVFWTSLALMLSQPPYSYNEATIGLFGLVGLAGAAAARYAGIIADRGRQRMATGLFLGCILLGYGFLIFAKLSLIPLLIGVLLLDLGVQGTHITNQTQLYRVRAEVRSRVTSVYMTVFFAGGVLGSTLSSFGFRFGGWRLVALAGMGVAALNLIYYATESKVGSSKRS